MNQRSDIDRILQVWMADGPTVMPDRVVDVVATRIGVQRQRRAWPFPGRTNVTSVKLIAGLAAAIVVAVVGYALLPRQPSIGSSSPAPTVVPTVAASAAPPSTAPSTTSRFPAWFSDREANGAGTLTAGDHASRLFSPAFTFRVPAGWVNNWESTGQYSMFPDTAANQTEFARNGRLANSITIGPHPNPWFVCESAENNAGATAAEMVTALTGNDALATSGVTDVEIGGLSGKQFDVRLNPDWTGTCTSADDPPGSKLEDYRVRGILLDVPGDVVIVIFADSWSAADFPAFLDEAMPVIESIEFAVK
jgi:hypothetical protein